MPQTVFCTLGPEGTCHDNALKNFIRYQNVEDFKIVYTSDFFKSAEELAQGKIDFIVQNSAHPQVAELCPIYRGKVFMVDTFVFPTKSMGILCNKNKKHKMELGLMPATTGYVDKSKWSKLEFEVSNPIVAKGLLEGKYGYGVTFIEYIELYPDVLELVEDFGGPLDSVWIVYGQRRKCTGEVMGLYQPQYYSLEQEVR